MSSREVVLAAAFKSASRSMRPFPIRSALEQASDQKICDNVKVNTKRLRVREGFRNFKEQSVVATPHLLHRRGGGAVALFQATSGTN